MKKTLVSIASAVAVTALFTLGAVSPASADVTVIAPISGPGLSNDTYGWGVAVSHDGTLAASSIEYAGVTIYNVSTGSKINVTLATLGTTDIAQVAFSTDNQYLFVADYDGQKIKVVKTSDGSIDRSISLGFNPWMLEASRDGAYLYVTDYDGRYYQMDLSDDSLSDYATGSNSSAYSQSMCLSADGAKLYAPNYSDGIDVITTSDMSETTLTIAGAGRLWSCELDNAGNLIVSDYDNTMVYKLATDGTILESVDLSSENMNIYSAVPSCDSIFIADENNRDTIPVLDLATFESGTALVPDETLDGMGFYGYNGDRSLDGSVVALSGYWSSDALVILKSSCETDASPALPDTGLNSSAIGGIALSVMVAGVISLIAIRRRQA